MSIPFINTPREEFALIIKRLLKEIPAESRSTAKSFISEDSYCLSKLSHKILLLHLMQKASFSESEASLFIEITPISEISEIIKLKFSQKKFFSADEYTYQICNDIIRYWNTKV